MIGFIFPVPVAWTWGQGWLTQIGYTDFSGSGMVHLVGGIAGFMGAFFIGPRIGKNEDPQEVRKDP
jgi:Amt family ammonium transporter